MQYAIKYWEYVDAIGQGGDMSRAEAAEHFGVHRSTATYNLERAVAERQLERYYSYASNNQPGWIYRLPGTAEPLPFDNGVESDHAPDWDYERSRDDLVQIFDDNGLPTYEVAPSLPEEM